MTTKPTDKTLADTVRLVAASDIALTEAQAAREATRLRHAEEMAAAEKAVQTAEVALQTARMGLNGAIDAAKQA